MLHPLVHKAMQQAALSHATQQRKGSGIPYIVHVMAVYAMTSQLSADPEVHCAALLHDVIEDQPETYSWQRMHEDFGAGVVELVQAVTKDDTLPDWRARNEQYLQQLRAAPRGAVLIVLADKTHNLQSMLEDHHQVGEKLWERFNAPKASQQWWYRANLEVFEQRLDGAAAPAVHDALEHYRQMVTQLQSL